MAKTFVEYPEDQTRIPFLRGIMIHSLQDSGLPFKKASSLASTIRRELNRTALITNGDLAKIVIKHLEKMGDEVITSRYENRHTPLMVLVKHRDGHVAQFSRQEFRSSLETIGLKSKESDEVVQILVEHLTNRYFETIKYSHLATLVYRYLRQSSRLGPAVAHRWLVWHDFVNSGRGIIFLIGGTAGCGKSTIANTLASRLDIVRTQSTDMLREVMRTLIPAQLMPVLHQSSFTAWKGLPDQKQKNNQVSEAQLIQGYRSQADSLSLAIQAVIERTTREHVSLILEGVHIHPAFMEKLQAETDVVVIPIMLGLLKRKQLQERIQKRSTNAPDRGAEHYQQHFDEIWRLQTYLLSEADRANIPIAVNESRDNMFAEIMRHTIATLAETFDSTPEKVFGDSPRDK